MNWDKVNFDWNHIRAFLVTAQKGTLSAAATELGLTQPTLSRQVYALEVTLKLTLFERVGQRLIITNSGLELLKYAEEMGKAALDFSLSATGQSQQIEGLVTVSASELAAVYVLPKIIAKLRVLEPAISIEVVVSNEASDLKRREADIAIRGFQPEQNDLIARKLGEEKIWLYAPQEYINKQPKVKKLSELTDIQIIGFETGNSTMDILNKQGWNLSKSNFSVVTPSQTMQVKLCEEGMGMIFLPQDIASQFPKLKCAFDSMGPLMTLPVWLVCHQELRTSLRVRRVFDFIGEEFKRHYNS